ncbi:hypothetical protein AGMMS49949_05120 [Alphaproteobacteria bacterium]|nr:hypothetical protein AGMMS49949_05120 [Alphaproteobacteria bacterium]GHT00142.1 hypothetical protein AGMMS50296_8410 [Alphaproteobacteria bacterium]
MKEKYCCDAKHHGKMVEIEVFRKKGDQAHECVYQFGRKHLGKPGEHIRRYFRRGNKAVPDVEIDPQTGNIIGKIKNPIEESWF